MTLTGVRSYQGPGIPIPRDEWQSVSGRGTLDHIGRSPVMDASAANAGSIDAMMARLPALISAAVRWVTRPWLQAMLLMLALTGSGCPDRRVVAGQVVELDGRGAYVELPERLGEELAEFTLEMRVRWDHLGYFDAPLHFGDTDNAVGFNHQTTAERTPVVFVQPGTPAPIKAVAGRVIVVGQWIHLAATVGPEGVRLYVNGECLATNASPVPRGFLTPAPARWLGRSPWADNGYFRGAFDDVGVWSRRLSADEIRRRRRAPLTGSEDGLMAAWTFDFAEETTEGPVTWSVGRERLAARFHRSARLKSANPTVSELFLEPVRLRGVLDSGARRAEPGRIRLWQDERLVQETTADSSGAFGLDLVAPSGEFELEAHRGDWGTRRRLSLIPGGRSDLALQLHLSRSIMGRVTTMNGAPQIGVKVEAWKREESASGTMRDPPVEVTRTDAGGRFEFLNLREGSYRIVCVRPPDSLTGGMAADPEQSCEVRSGHGVELADFRLPRLLRTHTWRPVGRDDGLPEPEVTAVAAGPEGRVWIGTSGGLARYEGAGVSVWRRENGLPSDSVTALALDTAETLWIGTASGLACLTNGRVIPAAGRKAPVGRVNALVVAPDQSVWVGTDQGLARWRGSDWVWMTAEDGLPSRLVKRLKVLASGTLLVGTDGGLVTWKDGGFQLPDPMGGPPGLPQVNPVGMEALGSGQRLFPEDWQVTPNGDIWAIADGDLYWFNGRNWFDVTWRGRESPMGWVTSLSIDTLGSVWVGTLGNGAWRRLPEQISQMNEADGLPGRGVTATARTPEGDLWIGTDGGLARWRGEVLQNWTPSSGFPARGVTGLLADRSGRLWVATDQGGFWFDGVRFSAPPGLPDIRINAISEGPDAAIWLATGGGGIFRWNEREGTQRFGTDRGLWESHLSAILAARNGTVWYTQNSSLAQVTPTEVLHTVLAPDREEGFGRRGGFRVMTTNQSGRMDPRWPTATSALAEAPDGAVWAGTYRQGLLRFHGGEWTHFPAGSGLPSSRVLALHVAGDGRLWCGTGVGACVFDGELWGVLDTRDGLAGDQVLSIRSDADGTLWFGTDQGLTRYVPARRPIAVSLSAVESREVRRLPADLVSAAVGERMTIAAVADRGNRVRWKITGPGLPGDWSSPEPSLSLVFRPDRPGPYAIEAMAVDRDLNRSKPARMEFQVTRPWFRNPWWIGSAWALGLVVAGGVILIGVRGRRSRLEAERLRREARERSEQERLRGQFARELIGSQEAERRRLAHELHDSLGQELLLIRNTALLASRAHPDSDQTSSDGLALADIAERASRTIEEVRSIAYALRPQELDRLGLVRALQTLCEEMTEASGLRLGFEADPFTGSLAAGAEISLYRVVQEALSNVVRHAGARRVEFRLAAEAGRLVVRLHDDGIGFDLTRCLSARSTLGLVGMKERIRLAGGDCRIISGKGEGTLIEFSLPFELEPTPVTGLSSTR